MSVFDQKDEILKALEAWFKKEHPGHKFNPSEWPKDVSLSVKSILAIGMNEDEVIERLEEIGLDPNFQTNQGFKLWQLALMHGRPELAKKLYAQQASVLEPTKEKPKKKK